MSDGICKGTSSATVRDARLAEKQHDNVLYCNFDRPGVAEKVAYLRVWDDGAAIREQEQIFLTLVRASNQSVFEPGIEHELKCLWALEPSLLMSKLAWFSGLH